MNHWLQRTAPDRADSTVVNQLEAIVDRARECAAARGPRPNFLVVNLYNIGHVVAATAEINGVG